MDDDATAGRWEPPADQPVTPQPDPTPDQSRREPRPEPSWSAPAFGPPPSSGTSAEPTTGAHRRGRQPAAAGFVYPEGAGNPYRVDYLESPTRRRSPLAFIVIGLVVLALIGAAVGLVARGSNSRSPAVAGVASASASAPAPEPTAPSPAPSGGAQPPAAATPLDGYLLPPSALGAGTLMALIPDGRSVTDQATLDFCNFDYTSEKLRDTRVQVQYVGGSQAASNEFVRYRSGGAELAFSEIQQAVARCSSSYRDSGGEVSGIRRLTGLTGLAKNNAAVSFTSTYTGIGGVVRQSTTVIYQFDGDYFSGVYVYGTDANAVQSAAVKLGAASAKLLAEAAVGKPGTGGGPLATPQDSTPAVQA